MKYILRPKWEHIIGKTYHFDSKQELVDFMRDTRTFELIETSNKTIAEIDSQLNDYEIVKDYTKKPKLPSKMKLDGFDFLYDRERSHINDDINSYLANTYGFCVNGFNWEITIKLTDIDWDTEE